MMQVIGTARSPRRTLAIATAPTKTMLALAAGLTAALACGSAGAVEFDTGNPELKIRWDNAVKYSAGVRVKDRLPLLASDPNADDGNRNFNQGLISNRVDLLSDFDVTYQNVGMRVSGAAWYDRVYNRATDNDSPFTYNALSVSNRAFPRETRDLHGRRAEVLDAFVFAKGNIGDMPSLIRVGRHALVYGESLFFGGNAIANAQQPVDVAKLLSVPNLQFKEIIRPVNQVSGQVQILSNLTVGAYYQLKWEKTLLPGAGSYFNATDFLGDGAERLLTGPRSSMVRSADTKAKDSGQGGMQLRWSPSGSDVDLGLYAAQYHDKTPQIVLHPFTSTYNLMYHENIRTYGMSASTSVGILNVAGEVSVRRNTPLVQAGTADLFGLVPVGFGGPAAPSDNVDNTSYPVGNSAHLNVSVLATLTPNFLAQESALVAELAWNRVTSVSAHAEHVDPGATRDGWGMRLQFTPTYRQVVSGLDLSVPFGLSYFPKGRSSVITAFGADKGGDVSIGLNGKYLSEWDIGLTYTRFYGGAANPTRLENQHTLYNFKQSLKDRDFVSLSISKTF